MVSLVMRAYRRLRFGNPIIVVTGLPRSGTSMAMNVLQSGGIEVLVDGVRTADQSNPRGYYELERVKSLDKNDDRSWLVEARGKAIKIICFLLTYLPETNNYKLIFMHRNLDEIVASQNTMLAHRGEPIGGTSDRDMRRMYEKHLQRVESIVARRRSFDVLDVEYAKVLDSPRDQAIRIGRFLGRTLDVEQMAAAVDPQLYRTRRDPELGPGRVSAS